jgi:23S rRNA (uracil1939-C5)-methyltransferase
VRDEKRKAPNKLEFRTVQLKIEKLVYGGDGLARLPADERGTGKSVFVPFVLEGEQAEVTLTEQKPGFARGRLEQVLEPSAHRVEPPCPYFQRCGGCHYQHSNYAHQLEIKVAILRETLKRTAKLDLECELIVHASPEWNYRNRTRLKVQTAPKFALGYYRFRSHDLLPIEQCPISSPLINRAITATCELGRTGVISALREIEFFADHHDGALLIEAYCARGTPPSDAHPIAEQLSRILPEVQGVAVFEQPAPNQFSEPRRVAEYGNTQIQYQTAGGSYRVSAGAFFQVNRFQLDELVNVVYQNAKGQCALDLYAGVGLFSAVLAGRFAQVIAVEASQTSHADLRHNCGREVKAVLATTEQYLQQVSSELRPDLVVADPPRGGLGENVIRNLAKLTAARLIYVSCDPSTLARDLRMLLGLGFKVERAHLFDLFPQTYHIESVFHLAR